MSVSTSEHRHGSMVGLVRCLGFTCLLVVGVCLSAVAAESPLKSTPIPEDAPQGFKQLFAKQVDVFGIMVYATETTPDKKVLHAANVLAQYLDNDADGQPDNPLVIEAMRKHRAGVMMCATEREMQRIDMGRRVPDEVLDKMVLQGLFGEETRPGGASRGEFDATLEEVLHLITDAGYGEAYPEVFGRESGTAIAKAMDVARGGHFDRVPRQYPAGAWYTYYDKTCRYRCQMSEYFYWGLTSILGAQDYPGRLDEIDNEWRLNTAAKVKAKDPTLYKLLTDPKYKLPTVLPDGNYRPRKQRVGQGGRLPSEKNPKVIVKKREDRVAVEVKGNTTAYSITSPSGIGGATISPWQGWPKQVVVRIHLRGLESFTVSSGNIKLSASVLSHGGNPRLLHLWENGEEKKVEQGSPFWMEVKALKADGKPVAGLPGKGGYFEIALPRALLQGNPKSLTLGWVDFYRN